MTDDPGFTSATATTRVTSLALPQNQEDSALSPRSSLDTTTEKSNVALSAYLHETCKLFPTGFSRSIVRVPDHKRERPWAASIAMVSPESPYADPAYEMRIELYPNKVQNIARDLFGAVLEISNGVTSVQTKAFSLEPGPSMTLRGCRPSSITEILGPEVGNAVKASFIYQGEKAHELETTSSVSMEILRDASQPGTLSLIMGIHEGYSIYNRLYVNNS